MDTAKLSKTQSELLFCGEDRCVKISEESVEEKKSYEKSELK